MGAPFHCSFKPRLSNHPHPSWNKRKYCTNFMLRITLWFAFLLADWVTTISLGVLSNKVGQKNEGDFVEPKYVIISLWAPFLLIHLGGSDTITAYSMEDNELWRRRFVSFIVQVVGHSISSSEHGQTLI